MLAPDTQAPCGRRIMISHRTGEEERAQQKRGQCCLLGGVEGHHTGAMTAAMRAVVPLTRFLLMASCVLFRVSTMAVRMRLLARDRTVADVGPRIAGARAIGVRNEHQ